MQGVCKRDTEIITKILLFFSILHTDRLFNHDGRDQIIKLEAP